MCVSMSHISALCVCTLICIPLICMHMLYMCSTLICIPCKSVCVCAIVSTYVSQCMMYQCVQTYMYKWNGLIRWNQLLLPAGHRATMRQGCPFGAFPPFAVPPTGCCWGIQQSCPPRIQTSQSLLPQHLLPPQTHCCSTGKISPAQVLGLKRCLKNCLYLQDFASQSQRTSHYREPLRHFPLLHHHFKFHTRLFLLLLAHSQGSCLHCWPQWCLFQMNPVSHQPRPLLSWPPLSLQPGNVQNSEPLLPHSQTLPGSWCCPEHT